jgi:hypothetical protein
MIKSRVCCSGLFSRRHQFGGVTSDINFVFSTEIVSGNLTTEFETDLVGKGRTREGSGVVSVVRHISTRLTN